MKIFFCSAIMVAILWSIDCKAQTIKLSAEFNTGKSVIKLSWNMINNSSKTSYLILRSPDGILWTEAAKDKILRNYTTRDFYSFEDKFYTLGKNFYRLKISDGYNTTVALSPIVTVNTFAAKGEITATWVIYQNPVNDVLTLNYKGSADIKGVVNIQIMDETGRIVTKFRSASIYKTIQIPVNQLKRGYYVTQVMVMNEIVMNKQFIKQ